ncbi:MAG: hypothetical protein DRJ52_05665 [Thermoprotei archaeon]|nr:MAG: hypothetical protein DRJ52_05665 [Thermoprotei archaeon]
MLALYSALRTLLKSSAYLGARTIFNTLTVNYLYSLKEYTGGPEGMTRPAPAKQALPMKGPLLLSKQNLFKEDCSEDKKSK